MDIEAIANDESEEEDEEEEDDGAANMVVEDESPEEIQASFERLLKERLIYGLLDVRYHPYIFTFPHSRKSVAL